MATERAKTNVEAQRRITEQMDSVRPLLRKAMQSNDKAAIEKYSNEMTRLDRLMRATATITVGGVDVPIGAIGSGIQSGISGLFTAIPDIAIAGYNYFKPEPDKNLSGLITGQQPQKQQTPSLSELGTKYLGTQNEPMSDEQAYAFRMSQGAGSAAVPSTGVKGLLLGTGLGAGDVAVSQATDAPEGLLSGLYAVGNLTRAGFKGIQGLKENRKLNKFIDENVPVEGQNVFRQFMLRGQGSDSPIVAAAIQKLRSQPEYAELFAKFDQAASDFSTKGMAPVSRISGKQEATEAIATRVQREIDGLRQQRSEAGNRVFEQAKGYGADRGIVSPEKTIKEIDGLISDYSKRKTPNSDRAVQFLTELKSRMLNESGSAKKLTVDETQAVLSEFGRKATQGDSLVKDLAISDEIRISAKIFGGLKEDLQTARRLATSPEDKAAAGLLIQAREQVRKASDNYNENIAQGLPAFLKDKPLSSISYEDLYANYKTLNEPQRAKLRSYAGSTDQEALNFLDRNIFQDFVKSAQGKNDAGILTTDLEKLATKWQSLGDNERYALVTALGTNAKEFDQRMKDALVFTRRMRVSQPVAEAEKVISPDLQRGVSASVGVGGGYGSAKAVDVAMTTFNELFKRQGLTDEQLMKMLLTPEGADFLRQGSLTGASRNTLDAFTKIPSTLEATAPALSAISRLISAPAQAPAEPTQAAPDEVFIPEDIFTNQPVQQPTAPVTAPPSDGEVFIPEDIFTSGATTPPRVDVNANKDERQGIYNQELGQMLRRSNAAQASGDQGAFERVTADIQALLREAQRNNLQLSAQ